MIKRFFKNLGIITLAAAVIAFFAILFATLFFFVGQVYGEVWEVAAILLSALLGAAAFKTWLDS